jgi:hypothetical protein
MMAFFPVEAMVSENCFRDVSSVAAAAAGSDEWNLQQHGVLLAHHMILF